MYADKSKGGGRPSAAPHPYAYNDVESLGRLYLELFVRPLGGFLMAHYGPTPRTTGGHVHTYVRTLRVGTIQAARGYPYTIPRCFFRNQPLLAVGDNPLRGGPMGLVSEKTPVFSMHTYAPKPYA